MEKLDPRSLLFQDSAHLPDQFEPPLVVPTRLHLKEKLVIARIGKVRGVGSASVRAAHGCPEKKEEVLGVGIVRHPAPLEDLVCTAPDLVLELVVARGGDADVEADLAPRIHEELELEQRRGACIR